jgi:hypothetical protein
MDQMDTNKSAHYKRVKDNGGSYRDFLGSPQAIRSLFSNSGLWSLSIYNKLPQYLIQKMKDRRRQGGKSKIEINFGYRKLLLGKQALESVVAGESSWALFEDILLEIFSTVNDVGAIPILLFYPDIHLTALPYIKGHDSQIASAEANYLKTVSRLAVLAKRGRAIFLDSTSVFREQIKKKALTTSASNYHLNTAGTELLFNFVRDEINFQMSERQLN